MPHRESRLHRHPHFLCSPSLLGWHLVPPCSNTLRLASALPPSFGFFPIHPIPPTLLSLQFSSAIIEERSFIFLFIRRISPICRRCRSLQHTMFPPFLCFLASLLFFSCLSVMRVCTHFSLGLRFLCAIVQLHISCSGLSSSDRIPFTFQSGERTTFMSPPLQDKRTSRFSSRGPSVGKDCVSTFAHTHTHGSLSLNTSLQRFRKLLSLPLSLSLKYPLIAFRRSSPSGT